MKVALLQEERYLPSFHGSNKSNRCLLESLAREGHDCLALCSVSPPERAFMLGLQFVACRQAPVMKNVRLSCFQF